MKLYTNVFCFFSCSKLLLHRQRCLKESIVHHCSNTICFMPFHHVSLITSCWQLWSTEWYKLVMQTDRPHQSVSCTSWWCVWADVCNVAVLRRSPEISRTSGKRQLSELTKQVEILSYYSLETSPIQDFSPLVFFLKFLQASRGESC